MTEDEFPLCSIRITWNSDGLIDYSFDEDSALEYANDETVAFSIPLIVSEQLGSQNVYDSLLFCRKILDFLENKKIEINPIGSSVTVMNDQVFIYLYEGEPKTVVFSHSSFVVSNSLYSVKDIQQLILNFILHVDEVLSSELRTKMRFSLSSSIYLYLVVSIPKILAFKDFRVSYKFPELVVQADYASRVLSEDWDKQKPYSRQQLDVFVSKTRKAFQEHEKLIETSNLKEIDKYKILTDYVLPAMQEKAIEDFVEKEQFKKEVTNYAINAYKERERTLTTRKILIGFGFFIFALVILFFVFSS